MGYTPSTNYPYWQVPAVQTDSLRRRASERAIIITSGLKLALPMMSLAMENQPSGVGLGCLTRGRYITRCRTRAGTHRIILSTRHLTAQWEQDAARQRDVRSFTVHSRCSEQAGIPQLPRASRVLGILIISKEQIRLTRRLVTSQAGTPRIGILLT